nr:FG-GAP-like repeat-containing protein [Planctomycetota bacterium]
GLFTGDRIYIEGTTGGFTEINNGPNFRGRPAYWDVIRVDANTFRIQNPITGAIIAGTGTFGGSPVWTLVAGGTVSAASNTDPSLLTINNHGLVNGNRITISGARGNTAINNGIVPTVTISDATNANPSVLTSVGHGLVDGEQITVTGAVGNTAINGTWLVDVLTVNTFQLLNPNTMVPVAGNGTYVPGTAQWRRTTTIADATNANPSVITSPNHGLVNGEWIDIVGAAGNTAINGTWVVEVLTAQQFQLRNPDTNALAAGNGAYTGGGLWSRATPQQWTVQVVDANSIRLVHPGTGMIVAGNGAYVAGTAEWGGGILGRHSLSTGDVISVSGSGVTTANGVAVVRVINSSSFELYVPNSGFTTLVAVLGDGSTSTGGSYYVHNASKFHYDGIGPSTFRIENNWDVSGFERGDGFNFVTGVGSSPVSFGYDEVDPGTFSFLTAWINDVTVDEGNVATLTVTLTEDAPVGGVTLFYRLTDGTALADPNNDGNPIEGDYDPATTGVLFIAGGQRTGTITVQVKTDNEFDPGEQFYVDLYQISTGDFVDSRGVVSIRQTPQITITNAQIAEGDSGTKTMTFTVNLATDDPSQAISVNYATSNGTATAGSGVGADYFAKSGTVTFGPGETSKTITITIRGDLDVEANETFFVTLSNATGGATLPAPVATGTIVNDDTPSISISDPVVTEGSGNATFVITLSKAVNSPVTVTYTTANQSATAGQDYAAKSGTVTFMPGETSKSITIVINDDNIAESLETFVMNLSNATNGTIVKAAGTATINDDDTPTVTIVNSVTQSEGDGPGTMVFTVTLSQASAVPVTVSYSTGDQTATAGTDYVAKSGTITFAAGETTKTIVISTIGDRVIEQTERFVVSLTNAVNGNITQATSTGVIIDDDTPTITIDDVGVLESDGIAFFTVSLSKPISGSSVTVDFATAPGTAAGNGVDFFTRNGTLVFQPGQSTLTIFVQITQDNFAESIETFFVNLSMPTNATIAKAQGVGRIIDAAFATTLVVAPSTGAEPQVKVYGADPNTLRFPAFYAYDPSFRGGVRVAVGDVNGDGVADIIAAPNRGAAPVRVFDGKSGSLISSFFPFSSGFTGGYSIAAEDINGDGRAEIFVGLASNGSAVRVFNGANGAIIAAYYAFSPAFTGGVNVAVGNVTGDGAAELIVSLASQGSAIRVLQPLTGNIVSAFYPFSDAFLGGINVAVGDVNGDGRGEIIAGLATQGSAIRVFDMVSLVSPAVVSAFQAFPGFAGGVTVGTTDLNFDGRAEIIAAPAASSTPGVRFFNGVGQVVASTNPFPQFNTGGWVAGETLDLVGQPLRLEGSALAGSTAAAVTQSQVDALVQAAAKRLVAAGASAALLANVQIAIADLPGSYLGVARAGVVVIDVNAGGKGWFVDNTPDFDEEFARDKNGVYRAVAAKAKGKVDLLTVITHELAHQLGFDDLNPAVAPNSLMTGTLGVSVRRATKESIDDLFASNDLLNELLSV